MIGKIDIKEIEMLKEQQEKEKENKYMEKIKEQEELEEIKRNEALKWLSDEKLKNYERNRKYIDYIKENFIDSFNSLKVLQIVFKREPLKVYYITDTKSISIDKFNNIILQCIDRTANMINSSEDMYKITHVLNIEEIKNICIETIKPNKEYITIGRLKFKLVDVINNNDSLDLTWYIKDGLYSSILEEMYTFKRTNIDEYMLKNLKEFEVYKQTIDVFFGDKTINFYVPYNIPFDYRNYI